MRIGIDAREIEAGVRTGIGRALDVFLDYFGEREDDNTAILFSTCPVPRPDSPRIRNIVTPATITPLWDQVTLPGLIRKEKIDLFYSTYYKIPFCARCPCVSTIYDLMYLTFPPYRKGSLLSMLFFTTIGRLFVWRTARIMTSSAFSKKEILSFYRTDPEIVSVIPPGLPSFFHPAAPDSVERVKKAAGIDGEYILYTGNFKPHKNVGTLVRAFAAVHRRFPALSLVLAGAHDRHFAPVAREINDHGLNKCVITPGAIEETDLPALYSGARLFVMPSLFEGFGYPPLEAMACGTPVVCSNAASLPEVIGDAALIIDTREPGPMSEAMGRVLASRELARSLSEKGVVHVRPFLGERYAEALYSALITTCSL
ncbi:MAG: glycosyltransferase family 4 protein [Chitinispirillaceae bacterium]|nr:glycosyltransferase family 4 protein [Chitinispirillaceae bacterium]